MQVWQIEGGFGLANLRQSSRERPQPGPGQVLVAVRAASLNYRDLLMINGDYNPRQALPLVPASDGAGEVVAIGAGVDRVAIGDRVAAIFAQHWLSGPADHRRIRSSTLGGPLDGMLSEYQVFDADGLVTLPEHLSFAEGATLPCAALTAWSALTVGRALLPGETVLLQGTGGVSLFALQFAKLLGAQVIITSSSDVKLARAGELGADHLLNYRDNPNWHKQARVLTGGRGVDRVIEVGGAGTLEKSLAATAMGGVVAAIGVLAGVSAPLNVLPIVMSSLTLQGVQVGSRDSFIAMNRAVSRHDLQPVIGASFGFSELPAALQLMAAGEHFGKIVIEVS